MANRAPLPNKLCLLVGLLLSLYGCQQRPGQTVQIPAIFVSAEQAGWQQRDGRLWLNDSLFSGWQYQRWPSGDTAFVGGFVQGKAEGLHRHWHANHQSKESRHFQNGWQEGEQRGWFESGKPAFVYHFQNDVYEGNRKEWLPTGQLVYDGNYHEGQEEGGQRQWFADGSLKMNYVVRKGRTYGFTGVKNCVNVGDSVAVSHK